MDTFDFQIPEPILSVTMVTRDKGGGSSKDPPGVLHKEKAPVLSHQGFFFVAEADKISILNLVGDIINIIEFLESNVYG